MVSDLIARKIKRCRGSSAIAQGGMNEDAFSWSRTSATVRETKGAGCPGRVRSRAGSPATNCSLRIAVAVPELCALLRSSTYLTFASEAMFEVDEFVSD